MLHHVACSLRGYYGNMTLTRVDSVVVGSLQLFEWDHTRSQENKASQRLHRIHPRRGRHMRVGRQCAGPPATNRDFGWGVGSFARGAGSAKPARVGTLPPNPRDKSPDAPTRGPKCVSGDGDGHRRGVGGFELGAGWVKPNAHDAAGRSAGGCERVTTVNLALRGHTSALVGWRRSASVYRYNVF